MFIIISKQNCVLQQRQKERHLKRRQLDRRQLEPTSDQSAKWDLSFAQMSRHVTLNVGSAEEFQIVFSVKMTFWVSSSVILYK
jgi:hypothetical protein